MSFLLDLAYLALLAVAWPALLILAALRPRWRAGWGQRLGWIPHMADGAGPCVWLHAVSVGEVNLLRGLVESIRRDHPDWRLAISTFTDTGYRVAKQRYGTFAQVFYFPLDFSFTVRRTLKRIRPDVVVLAELEIWPNFLRAARAAGVPVVIVNGRMREEKVRRYAALSPLWSPLRDPQTRNAYCVQNETYADRFRRAGFPADRIRVAGAMKYDAVPTEADAGAKAELARAFGLSGGESVWIGGCTWPGEEDICLNVQKRLAETLPGARLILAPRHVERAGQVERAVEKAGFAFFRRTSGGAPPSPDAVLLLDTVGELCVAYALAQAAFVGKSLTASGGHNVLEPAALGVPVLFGPKTDNFAEETALLLSVRAAELVKDEPSLYNATLRFVSNSEARKAAGARGREATLNRRGATQRCLEAIRERLVVCP